MMQAVYCRGLSCLTDNWQLCIIKHKEHNHNQISICQSYMFKLSNPAKEALPIGKERQTLRRLRVCSAMRPLLGSPIRTTVRSTTRGDKAAAGLADTAVAEAAARGATERALAASERQRARCKLDCGEGDWDRGRTVNCAGKSFLSVYWIRRLRSTVRGKQQANNAIINLQDSKSITQYNGYKEKDRQITLFWKAVERMSIERQAAPLLLDFSEVFTISRILWAELQTLHIQDIRFT